jgi:transposase-like protein
MRPAPQLASATGARCWRIAIPLSGLRLVVSDHHEGLKTAIAGVLDAPWQRCCVHFVRNMHGHCRPSQRGMVSAARREVFSAPTTPRRAAVSAR